MISKNVLSVLAVILALVMISPSMMAVTLDESEILVDMESEHETEYDETVNLAGNATTANYDTWDPAPSGVWIGSTTEESLFKIGVVTAVNSTVVLTWEVKFSSDQIMSGVSEFTVRLPIYIDSYVTNVLLYVLAVDVVDSHSITTGTTVSYTSGADQRFVYQRRTIDPTDVSVMDGNDVFVRDHRMYVDIKAPIVPDQIYLFEMAATYAIDGNPSFYISPNDVANDAIVNSWVGWKIPTGPGVYATGNERFDIDWGASYDMVQGLGGGVTSFTFYLNPGDDLFFTIWAPYALGINGHHTICIPFYTDSGEATFNVTVKQRTDFSYSTWTTVIENNSAVTYDQMILVSNDTAMNVTGTSDYAKMFMVNLTSCVGQWVTFYFKNTPLQAYNSGGNNVTRYTMVNQDYYFPYALDADDYIGFVPISSYLVCPAKIETPVMGAVVEPEQTEVSSSIGEAIIGGIYAFWADVSGAIAKAFDIQTPGEAVVWFYSINNPMGVAWWVISQLTDLPSPVDVYRSVVGVVSNLIDWAWDALKAVGDFLWSIGEYIYDALSWLAEQIVEYGSYLLGLLIIAAALLIFFFPIHYQLKLWTAALLLAQGKIAQAQGQVEDVAKDIGDKAKKVGGML